MCLEHSYGLAGLYQEGLIIFEAVECSDNRVVTVPVARGLASATIHNQLFRLFRNFRIEVIHQHPFGCFLDPSSCRSRVAARRTNRGIRLTHRRTSSWLMVVLACPKAPSLRKPEAASIHTERTQSSRHAGTHLRKRNLTSSSEGVLVSF